MQYVDGFVIVVPKRKLPAYRRMARTAGKVWKELGAVDYRECVGDDLKTKYGTPFTKITRLKPSEAVVFSWIVYRSKADRNRINAKVMKDPRIVRMMAKAYPNLAVDFTLDPVILTFVAAVSVAAGLAFGLLPAWHATKSNAGETIKEQSRGAIGAPNRRKEGHHFSRIRERPSHSPRRAFGGSHGK